MRIVRIETGPRMSRAVIHSGTVYLAGMVADDPTEDIRGQTRQVLGKIERKLVEAGTDKSKLLSAVVFLSDINLWSGMNEVWDAWVMPGQTPARAAVQARLAGPTHQVEIVIIAAR